MEHIDKIIKEVKEEEEASQMLDAMETLINQQKHIHNLSPSRELFPSPAWHAAPQSTNRIRTSDNWQKLIGA